MTHEEFIECWEAACTHPHASYNHTETGGHLYGSYWYVTVGRIRMSLFAAPYVGGRHDRSIIKAYGSINGKDVTGGYMNNDDSLQCLNVWEAVQYLEVPLSKERVMKDLAR